MIQYEVGQLVYVANKKKLDVEERYVTKHPDKSSFVYTIRRMDLGYSAPTPIDVVFSTEKEAYACLEQYLENQIAIYSKRAAKAADTVRANNKLVENAQKRLSRITRIKTEIKP